MATRFTYNFNCSCLSHLFTGYSPGQLNYLRLCHLAFVFVAQELRCIFKTVWDDQYGKLFGEWMDTPRNGLDFYNLESPKKQRKFARQLATMINGNTEEWDCSMFFYAILYSSCLSHGASVQVRSAVDNLRTLCNGIVHRPKADISYREFFWLYFRAKDAFESLHISAERIESPRFFEGKCCLSPF